MISTGGMEEIGAGRAVNSLKHAWERKPKSCRAREGLDEGARGSILIVVNQN